MIHAVETNQDNKIEVEDSGVRSGGGTGGLCWEGVSVVGCSVGTQHEVSVAGWGKGRQG